MSHIFKALGGVTVFLLATPTVVSAYQSTSESVLEDYWSAETVKRLSSASSQSSQSSRSAFNDEVDRQILLLHNKSLNGSGSAKAIASQNYVSYSFNSLASLTPYYKRVTCGIEICEVVFVIEGVDPNGEVVKSSVLSLNEWLRNIQNRYKTLSPSIVTAGPGGKGVSVLYYIQTVK